MNFIDLMKVRVIFVAFYLHFGCSHSFHFHISFLSTFSTFSTFLPLPLGSRKDRYLACQTARFSFRNFFLVHALQTYFLFLAMQYGPASLHVRSGGIEYQYGGRKTGYHDYRFDLDYTPSK